MVAAQVGRSIDEIFERRGEAFFRAAETEALRAVPFERAIVVTGGGMVLRAENIERLRLLGTVVQLAADGETLCARLAGETTRPLLRTDNPRQTLSEMWRLREPLYRAAADLVVDTSGLCAREVAEEILRRIEHGRA